MNAIGLSAVLLLAQGAPSLLTYEAAMSEAQAKNLDLQAARARLDQAKTSVWKAWSFHLPQIAAGGNYTHNSSGASLPLAVNTAAPNPPATLGDLYFFSAKIQEVDQWAGRVSGTMALIAPSVWFGIAAASSAEEQAGQSYEAVRRDILFGVTQLYYGAVAGKYAVQIIEKQLTILLAHEKDARVRFEAGTSPKVALLRAEIDRAKGEQDLKAAQAAYDSFREGLAAVLVRKDADFDVETPAEPPLPPPGADLEEAAIRDRPDVQAAASAVKVADRTRSSVWASYFPTVGAFGNWNRLNVGGATGQPEFWSVGLALNWTILDGTLREAQLVDTKARTAEALASREGAEVRARSDVRRARLDLDAALANREKARETVGLARETQRLVEVSYRAGSATYLEVSDAANQLLQAELSNVGENLKARLAMVALLKAAGRFDPR